MTTEHDYIRQLFMEKLAGVLNPADEVILHQLLAKNEDNRVFWRSLNEQSEQINAAKFISDIDEHGSLQSLKHQLHRSKTHIWRYTAAAAIFIVAGIGIWLNFSNRANITTQTANKKEVKLNHNAIQLQLENGEILTLNKQDKNGVISTAAINVHTSDKGIEAIDGNEANAQTILHIPAKQHYQINLSDGTKVWLNSISKLRFPIRFYGSQREIYIEGEAYLEVAKDTKRPFIVHTKTTDIKVLGTKFNINTYNENTPKTSLVEGSVLLTSKNKSIKLTPGQEGSYNIDKGFSVTGFDQDQTLSWINGTYYFQNSSLKEISQVIKRWFDIEVIFENPQLGSLRLSGMLEKQQLAAFLKDLETSSDIHNKLVDNKLYLK